MRARLAAGILPWLSPLLASQALINEINFTPAGGDGQWIELANFGPSPVNLTGWSVYQATRTLGRAQNYWFGIPQGTLIKPGHFLRIHWLAALKTNDLGNVYTGVANIDFLFGLGAEPLDKAGGALALFDTTENARMNDSSVVQEWVQWGSAGWKRENLAVTNGRWVAGAFVQAPPTVESIAFLDYLQREPTPVSAYYRDRSPTPPAPPNFDNGWNFPSAVLAPPYGFSCTTGNIPTPFMELVSIPTLGNIDFGFRLAPVTPNSISFLLIAGERGNSSVFIGNCEFWLGLSSIPLVLIGSNAGNGSFVGMLPEDPAVMGIDIFAQWLTADLPTLAIGSSHAVQFRIGS
jgi:hypothetical protein